MRKYNRLFIFWAALGVLLGVMDEPGMAAGYMAIAAAYKVSATLMEIKDAQ